MTGIIRTTCVTRDRVKHCTGMYYGATYSSSRAHYSYLHWGFTGTNRRHSARASDGVVTAVVTWLILIFVKRILNISILVCGSNASTSPSISCSWQVLQTTVLPMLNQSLAPAIFHDTDRIAAAPSPSDVTSLTLDDPLRV